MAIAAGDLVDVRAAILGGLAGTCLAALVVLSIIDWLTGLHNAVLALGLTCAATLLAAFAAARLVEGGGRRSRNEGARGAGY